jgi:hypothetical protein
MFENCWFRFLFFFSVDSSTRVVEDRWVLERLLSKIEFDTSRTWRFFFSRYWIIDLIDCTKLDVFMIKKDRFILNFIVEHWVLTISFFTFVKFNSSSKNSWVDENDISSCLVFIRTESRLKKKWSSTSNICYEQINQWYVLEINTNTLTLDDFSRLRFNKIMIKFNWTIWFFSKREKRRFELKNEWRINTNSKNAWRDNQQTLDFRVHFLSSQWFITWLEFIESIIFIIIESRSHFSYLNDVS